ncbi:MAG: DUF4279 domain-containing protein [Clostridiales bacterium]|nr:DUF4279 domain-containing protein [Clostridiales bacterium]
MDQTTCYTYFSIRGDYDPEEITKILGIKPERTFRKGELNKVGHPYKCSSWAGCFCREYDIDLSVQMEKTIQPLLSKYEELNLIRTKYKAYLSLEVVPEIVYGSDKPILGPSMAVMQFCCATQTELDIDWYLFPPSDGFSTEDDL